MPIVSRSRRRDTASVLAATALALLAVPSAPVHASTNSALIHIGRAAPVPANATPAAAPADARPLHLRIELAPRDPAALHAFVTAVGDPRSPQYRHYLARGAFGTRFGADPAVVSAVDAGLRRIGLTPGAADGSGLSIPVDTTFGTARAALHTAFTTFTTARGRHGFVNTSAPGIPADLAALIGGIDGLDDVAAPAAQFQSYSDLGTQAVLSPLASSPHYSAPNLCAQEKTNLQNQSKADGSQYYDPGYLNAIYGTRDQYLIGNYGVNVTVALPEFEGFTPAAVAQYQNCISPTDSNQGTARGLTTITVDGGPTTAAPTSNNHVGMETALDIETINGTAPAASIRDYEGPDTTAGALDTYQRIVTDDQAQIIATGWGVCELDASPATLTSENTIFEQAAAQGQSVLAAAGDNGSTACAAGSTHAATPAVLDPASQPLVTAVGGTSMTGGSGSGLTTWNDTGVAASAGATGGGVSAVWTQDATHAAYQPGYTGPGYSNACNAPAASGCRQVPDVAAHAGADGLIVEYYATGTTGSWAIVGGTSLSVQLWAGIAALADSSDDCAGTGPIGQLNPALYQAYAADGAADFTDVTTGGNARPASGYTGGLYSAAAGYDLATGLGAPQSTSLITDLCSSVPAPAAGSTYHPDGPVRIMDTRDGTGTGGTIAAVPAGGTAVLTVTGAAGVPSTGVNAATLAFTVIAGSTGGLLEVWPDGTPRPQTSTLNWKASQVVANSATIAVPSDGKIDIANDSASPSNVLVDLSGYDTPAAGGSTFTAINPVRILDTRSALGVSTKTPVAALGTAAVQITGTHGIPSAGVTAVALNITEADDSAAGFVTAYPDGTTRPVTSDTHWGAGQIASEFTIVPLGSDGRLDLYNGSSGSADLIADLSGYYTTSATGLLYHPARPARLLDTRNGTGVNVNAGQPYTIPANGTFTVNLDPMALQNGGNPQNTLATAPAVAVNVTVASPVTGGWVSVYPDLQPLPTPTPTAINFMAAQNTADLTVVPVGTDGGLTILNHTSGTIQLVIDLLGYYAAS